jgi:hypothetical protein
MRCSLASKQRARRSFLRLALCFFATMHVAGMNHCSV